MALALTMEEIILAVALATFARTGLYFLTKYNEKRALGEEIKFENKYIVTGIFAAVLSFFVASISTEPVLALIPNAEQYSANGLFVLILGTAFSINELANKVISSLGIEKILGSNTLRNRFNSLNSALSLSERIRDIDSTEIQPLGQNINIMNGEKYYKCNENGQVSTNMSEGEIFEQEKKRGLNLKRP